MWRSPRGRSIAASWSHSSRRQASVHVDGHGRETRAVSPREQNPLAEQVEVRAAIHLAFERLDAVHGALDRAGAVRQGQAVDYGGQIAFEPGGK
jgi:hypothetical protein